MKKLTRPKIKLLKLLIVLTVLIIIDLALLIWTICDTKYEFLPTTLRNCLMGFSSGAFYSLADCVIMVIKKMSEISDKSDKNT
jgi:hypothetical protein